MQLLNSKNYNSVVVKIRNEEKLVTLNLSNGMRLMQFLTSDRASSHVSLTDIDGSVIVVRVTDILRVEPVLSGKDLAEYA